MVPQKIKQGFTFIFRYLAIGALFVAGGMAVLLGTQAFQTMSPSTPTATGTTLANNNSTGTYLAMRGRAPCSSGTAIAYEDKCLDLMTWTAANRTACFAKKWGGWISVNFEHLNAVNTASWLVWSYYGNGSPNARYGFKFFSAAWYATTANPIYSYYYNLWGGMNVVGNGIVNGATNPAGVPWVSPIIDVSYTQADNTSINFICAYFRDSGN